MNPPLHSIDVIIPAFNAEKFIIQTLQSVAKQDIAITNIIVVDDGSTDNTQACIEDFSKAHENLSITLINQTNAGLSAARNRGICHSKADYVALLDADDLWKSNKLSRQLSVFQQTRFTDLGLVYCAYELIDDAGKVIPSTSKNIVHPTLRGNIYSSLLKGNFISGSGSGVLVKRSVFESIGLFDENLRACEDWDMWLRIAKKYQFDFINDVLISIRVHQNNMQKDFMRMLSAELLLLNKFIEQGENNLFLLWKIRTYLCDKKMAANTLPGFDRCTPKLQNQLTGWRMDLACMLIAPARAFANVYLQSKNKV